MIAILAVVLAMVFSGQPGVPYWPNSCGYAKPMRDVNFPVSEKSKATEILHSAVFEWNKRPIGWLFQTVNGRLYYEDGPINPNALLKTQPAAVATMVLRFLALDYSHERLQLGTIYTVTRPPSLAHIPGGSKMEINSCY